MMNAIFSLNTLLVVSWGILGIVVFARYMRSQVALHLVLEIALIILCGPLLWIACISAVVRGVHAHYFEKGIVKNSRQRSNGPVAYNRDEEDDL